MRTRYKNGNIYTGSLPLQQAMVVEDGKYIFVGTNEEADKWDAQSEVDLLGKFIVSGFEDSHMHLLGFGNTLRSAALNEHTESLSDMLAYFRAFHAQHPVKEGSWLYGRGWNQDYYTDVNRMPNRHDLDSVTTEVPLCAVRACGHCLVVNSKALTHLGIDENTPQPEGGHIGMEDGKPDGRFFDNAMDLVYRAIPAPQKAEIKEMILAACKALNTYGITACQTDDYCLSRLIPWQDINDAYRELEAEGKLTVRVYEQANFTTLETLKEFVEAGNKTGMGTDFFRIGPLKMLGDGALGARTAFLSKPYADDPTTCGLPVFTQQVMDDMVEYANAVGMQVAVHAIGDACLDRVLHAIENALRKNPREDHRHGVVHCQISRPDQLQKIAELGLHVYAQSIFLDYDNHIVEARVGKELANTSYSWKTLMEKGVSVSNGSDCPVELPNVMGGIQCAVTRATLKDKVGPYLPEQAFTVQEALDSFTIRSAESAFCEGYRGKIAPGYLADFTILGGNPFETDADKLKDIPVIATYLNGKKIYG